MDLLDVDNRTLHAHYNHFHVDGEAQFYRLTLGLYSGNAGERFRRGGTRRAQGGAQGKAVLPQGQGRQGRMGPRAPQLSGLHLPVSVLGETLAP